jgi:uncharacterized alkaline shock family protein YloU
MGGEMKKFGIIFPMAISVIVGLLLIYLVLRAVGWIKIEPILESIQEQIPLTVIIGALLLGGGIYLAYFLVKEIYYGSAISLQNPEGEVRVSLAAIEEFLKRLEGEFEQVREMKPKLSVTKKGLEINVRLTLEPDTNIPEVTARVQGTIREYIEGVLGIKDVASVKVLITKIAHKEKGVEITCSENG